MSLSSAKQSGCPDDHSRSSQKDPPPASVEENSSAWLQQLCEAARRNEAGEVATLLGCDAATSNRTTGLDEPLAPSSRRQATHQLLQQLRQGQLGQETKTDDSWTPEYPHHNGFTSLLPPITDQEQVHLLYKALLLAPTAYELPWQAAHDIVVAAASSDPSVTGMRSRWTEVQSLLQQAVASWWEHPSQQQQQRESLGSNWSTPSSSSQKRVRTSGITTSATSQEEDSQPEPPAPITSTPRQWILRLAEVLVQPLYDEKSTDDGDHISQGQLEEEQVDDDNWEGLLPLASTLVSTCCHVDDASLLDEYLDQVFPPQTSGNNLLPHRLVFYLQLVQELRPWMRHQDYSRTVQPGVRHFLVQRPCACLEQLPTVATILVSVCSSGRSTAIGSVENEQDDWMESWQEVLFELLLAAAVKSSIFDAVETSLVSSFSALSPLDLMNWVPMAAYSRAETSQAPVWIRFNLVLLILRSAQRSGSQLVSQLVAQAFRPSATRKSSVVRPHVNVTSHCWTRLLSFLRAVVPSAQKDVKAARKNAPSRKRIRKPSRTQVMEAASRQLSGLACVGQGRFVSVQSSDENGKEEVAWVSIFGDVVYDVLSLGQQQQQEGPDDSADATVRAEALIHTANSVLESIAFGDEELLSLESLVLAVVSFVTVYIDVPQCRSMVNRIILETFSRQSDLRGNNTTDDVATSLYCLVVSALVQSAEKNVVSGIGNDLGQLKEAFSRRLPLPLFCDLAKALSPLPAMRPTLLAAAKRDLQLSFGSLTSSSELGVACRRKRDASEDLKCGLFALCVLISCDTHKNDIESDEAWQILSDIIVVGKPLLPPTTRSWLFLRLNEFVSVGSIQGKAVYQILCSCLVRLLKFFGMDQGGNLCLQPQRAFNVSVCEFCKTAHAIDAQMTEDLVALLELVFALVHWTVEHSANRREMRTFISSWRDKLSSFLQSQRGHPSSQDFNDAKELGETWPMLRSNNTELGLHVAMYFVVKLLEYVTHSEFSPKASYSPTEIASVLRNQELSSRGSTDSDIRPQLRPSWSEDPPDSLAACCSVPATISGDDRQGAAIGVATCDALTNFLIGSRRSFTGEASDCGDDDTLKRLCQGLGALLAVRRQLASSGDIDRQLEPSIASGSGTVYGVFVSYCPLALRVLEKLIVEDGDINETNEILEGLLDISSALEQLKDGSFHDSSAFDRLLAVLWELYVSLCENEAVVRLISYLESKLSAAGPESGKMESSSLLSIRTSDDIDQAVRSVRLSVLEAVLNYFSALLSLPDLDSVFRSDRSHSVLLNFIDTLSRDLLVGLSGDSGGLTPEIFILYLDCQQACARVITKISPSVERDDHRQSMISFAKAAKSVEEVVCSAPLTGATVFKKSMMLAACTFPSSSRLALKHLLLDDDGDNDVPDMQVPNFAAVAFGQCFDLLKRINEVEDSHLVPWEEIAGPEHCTSDTNGSDVADDASSSSEGDSHRISENGTSAKRRKKETKQGPNFLQLPTEGVWQWALALSLLGFYDLWGESHKLPPKQLVFQSDDGVRAYFIRRRDELALVFRTIGCLFECPNGKKLDTKSSGEANPYAVTMPKAAKQRLYALLDRIFVVLQRSLKALMADKPSVSESCRSRLENVEALSCIASWLEESPDGSEITIGAQRWYAAEKRRDAFARASQRIFISEDTILHQLPKLIFRIEELDWTLKKACQNLDGAHGKGVARKTSNLKLLHEMEALFSSSPAQDQSLSSSLLAKLQFLDEQQAKLEADLKGISDDGLLDARRKKRKLDEEVGRRVQRESRRRVVRSRNQLVDKWLYMDQLVGEDEAVDDDAYADLEDFLVDG